jgi:hypothetical protein
MHITFEGFQDFVKAHYPQAENFHELSSGYSCMIKEEHSVESINYNNCSGWYVARVTVEESYRGSGLTLDSAIEDLQLTFSSVPTPGGTRNIQKILECLDAFTTTVVEVLDTAGYGNQYLNATLTELNKAITDYTCLQGRD